MQRSTPALLTLYSCAFLAFATVGAPAASAAKRPPSKRRVTLESYVGTWTGKWDGKWKVRFTINRGDSSEPYAIALYEWQEASDGPMQAQRAEVVLQGTRLLVGPQIELVLSSSKPNQAIAVGHFAKTRKATLTRVGKAKR